MLRIITRSDCRIHDADGNNIKLIMFANIVINHLNEMDVLATINKCELDCTLNDCELSIVLRPRVRQQLIVIRSMMTVIL